MSIIHRLIGPAITFIALYAAYVLHDPLLRVTMLAILALVAAAHFVVFEDRLRHHSAESMLHRLVRATVRRRGVGGRGDMNQS